MITSHHQGERRTDLTIICSPPCNTTLWQYVPDSHTKAWLEPFLFQMYLISTKSRNPIQNIFRITKFIPCSPLRFLLTKKLPIKPTPLWRKDLLIFPAWTNFNLIFHFLESMWELTGAVLVPQPLFSNKLNLPKCAFQFQISHSPNWRSVGCTKRHYNKVILIPLMMT